MATDYDAPRVATEDEPENESLTAAKKSAAHDARRQVTEDEANLHEDLVLPGADLSHEELTVTVLPVQPGEFVCARCFLVASRSQRSAGSDVCLDCA